MVPHLIHRRILAVTGLLFVMSAFLPLTGFAIATLNKTTYVVNEPILTTTSGGPYVIYDLTAGTSLGGRGNFDIGDNVDPGTEGGHSYSMIETSLDGICEDGDLTYVQCKAIPEFVGEFLFTVVFPPPPPIIVGGGGAPEAFRPEVVVSTPARNQEFSNFVTIDYEAKDKNDLAEQRLLGLGIKPVTLYYSPTSDVRQRTLIMGNLPAVGRYIWDAHGVPEGDTYRVVARVVDNSNEEQEGISEEFSLDHITTSFSIRVDPPITTGEDVTISIDATRDLGAPPTVLVRQTDAAEFPVLMTGTSTHYEGIYHVVRGYDGPAIVKASVVDTFGNVSTTTVSGGTFSVGVRPPPQPIIVSPQDGETASSTRVTLRAHVRPDTEAFLSINGIERGSGKAPDSGDVVFKDLDIDPGFNGGKNFLTVTSRDLAGNISEPATVTLRLNLAPELRILSPRKDAVVATTTLITLSATDKNKDKLLFTYEVSGDDGVSWTLLTEKTTSKSYAWSTEEISDGLYKLRVSAFDGTVVKTIVSDAFAVKNISPRISFEGGLKVVINEKNTSVLGMALPSGEGDLFRLTSLEYRITGNDEWKSLPTAERFTIPFSDLTEGVHTVTVRARDAREVYGYASKVIIVDFGPPLAPRVETPFPGTVISGEEDEDKIHKGVQVTLKGKSEPGSIVRATVGAETFLGQTDAQGNFSVPGVTLTNHGENAVAVVAMDAAENVSDTQTVTYAYNNPPELKILSPREGRGVGHETVVQFSAVDRDLDPLRSLVISFAGPRSKESVIIARDPKGDSVVWDTSTLPDGPGYTLRLEATDGISTSRVSHSLFVDTTPPRLTLERFPEGVVQKEFVVDASGVAEDALSGVEFVEFSVDAKHWFKATIVSGYLGHRVTFRVRQKFDLVDGEYDLVFRAVDASGNVSNAESHHIIIDTKAPRVGSFTLGEGVVSLVPAQSGFLIPIGTSLLVTISLEQDTESASLHLGEISIPLAQDLSTGLWTARMTPQLPGSTALRLNATDIHGNSAEAIPLGTLTGIARGKTSPFTGVEVRVLSWNADSQSFENWPGDSYGIENPRITDERGEYEFLLPSGRYELLVKKSGFIPVRSAEFVLTASQFIVPHVELKKREGLRGAVEELLEKISPF